MIKPKIMSQTLYRKYRPKNFSEIIGQAHVVRTLLGSIEKNIIGQAYLFTGPRGTGKTSIARVFAKTINCKNLKKGNPCEKCLSCEGITSGKSLDIIEIDAASNTGVDNIRELRETVGLASASLKYKVYIIDEVHMLSSGAFNALLKTLEEPPTHVVFILATTEIHKVPETILSRCQRFNFSRFPLPDIIKKLEKIVKEEKIKINKEALEMIALSAEGGMRDAESLLGQIIALENKNITLKEVEDLIGTADKKTIESFTKMVLKKEPSQAIAKINQLLENGYDLGVFNKSFINYLRQVMLIKISPELKKHLIGEFTKEQFENLEKIAELTGIVEIIKTINTFLEAQNKISSFILPQLPLEIAIIKATQNFPENLKTIPKQSPPAKQTENITKEKTVEVNPEKEKLFEEKKVMQNKTALTLSDIRGNWNNLLTNIRPYNHSLSALLSNCQLQSVENNKIILVTPYNFYQERLTDKENKLTVEKVFSKILGSDIYLEVILDKNIAPKKDTSSPNKKAHEQDSLLSDAMEIMGGKVVKE